jgi:hypothetical protein
MASDIGVLGRAKATAAAGATGARNMWAGLGRTEYGRAFQHGMGEAFGWTFAGGNVMPPEGVAGSRLPKGTPTGFMGWKESTGYSWTNRRAAMARVRGGGIKGLSKIAARAFNPALIAGFTAFNVYEGYKAGGVIGAAGAAATEAAMWGGFNVAATALGQPLLWTLGGAAAAGYGYYQLGEASKRHEKRLRHLEMGATVTDPFGTAATLRQRSLAALHNTHINGRMAVGNEASLFHDGAYRR